LFQVALATDSSDQKRFTFAVLDRYMRVVAGAAFEFAVVATLVALRVGATSPGSTPVRVATGISGAPKAATVPPQSSPSLSSCATSEHLGSVCDHEVGEEDSALVQHLIVRHTVLGSDAASPPMLNVTELGPAQRHAYHSRAPRAVRDPRTAPTRTFTLVKMTQKASSMGAKCLDGTPGAFYILKSPPKYESKREWMIHLQGGGWCYDEPTCYNRSAFLGGSSILALPNRTGVELGLDGMMSDNCTVNPTFCNVNLVMAWYCDGASFAGNREEPVVYTDPKGVKHNLLFRGRRILEAVVDTLVEEYDLGKAKRVLLGGDSAGGMAAYLHANFVQAKLVAAREKLKRCPISHPLDFRVIPNSGFFLYHGNVEMKQVWQAQMYYLYYMANMTISDNSCLDAFPDYQLQHMCLFPQNVYPFIRAPIFVLNSALDMYQVANFLSAEPITGFPNWESSEISFWTQPNPYNASAAPGWEECSGGLVNISLCSQENILAMNKYMDSFEKTIAASSTFRKKGNGAFIYGCYNHDAEMVSLDWGLYAVDGVVMRDAVAAWWEASPLSGSAWEHTYVEKGRYKYPATVKDANPTCNYWADGIQW